MKLNMMKKLDFVIRCRNLEDNLRKLEESDRVWMAVLSLRAAKIIHSSEDPSGAKEVFLEGIESALALLTLNSENE